MQRDNRISRRTLTASLAGALAGCLSPAPVRAASALSEDANFPGLPPALASFSDHNAYHGPLPLPGSKGILKPGPDEISAAHRVLAGVNDASHRTPLEIATYFDAVGNGNIGAAYKPYIAAWPVRWNPVIVEFFTATSTKPSGDTTAWCAAFLNWCLINATIQRGNRAANDGETRSASSSSFRAWGRATQTPAEGDIVVFKSSDPGEADAGHGHVGLFLAQDKESILVLGGNQLYGDPTRHMICRKKIRKNGPLILHSYRTSSRLHA